MASWPWGLRSNHCVNQSLFACASAGQHVRVGLSETGGCEECYPGFSLAGSLGQELGLRVQSQCSNIECWEHL